MVVAILVAIGLRFAAVPAPASASRCAPRSTTARSRRSNGARPGPRRDARLGDRRGARRDRRHPHRTRQRASTRATALAPDRQRLRGRDHRPAAQPAAHVRRRGRARAHRRLPLRVPPEQRLPPGPAHREPRRSCCSSCCSSSRTRVCAAACAQPRVLPVARRGRARSRFAASSCSARGRAGDDAVAGRRDDLRAASSRSRSSRCRSCRSPASPGRSRCASSRSRRSARSVWAQWGTHGNPLVDARAQRSSPPWSARSIALPALRLSGIYLALATAALRGRRSTAGSGRLPPITVFGLFDAEPVPDRLGRARRR